MEWPWRMDRVSPFGVWRREWSIPERPISVTNLLWIRDWASPFFVRTAGIIRIGNSNPLIWKCISLFNWAVEIWDAGRVSRDDTADDAPTFCRCFFHISAFFINIVEKCVYWDVYRLRFERQEICCYIHSQAYIVFMHFVKKVIASQSRMRSLMGINGLFSLLFTTLADRSGVCKLNYRFGFAPELTL